MVREGYIGGVELEVDFKKWKNRQDFHNQDEGENFF